MVVGRAGETRLGSGNIQPHQLSRLAICAHGFPDVIDVDQTTTGSFGSQPDENTSLTPDRIGHYRRALEAIGSALAKDATVILACCLVANTETLLTHMSLSWPTVTIVGLRTVGLTHPKQRVDSRGGNPDVFPGIRDSPFETLSKNLPPAAVLERETAVFNAWSDLGRLPWLSESSPHATLVRNGSIIKRGNTPVLGAKL